MSAHGAKRRFYTPDEVRAHNTAKDCWVSIHGRVFDLTEVIAENRGPLTQPMIDVSIAWMYLFVIDLVRCMFFRNAAMLFATARQIASIFLYNRLGLNNLKWIKVSIFSMMPHHFLYLNFSWIIRWRARTCRTGSTRQLEEWRRKSYTFTLVLATFSPTITFSLIP